MWIKKRVVTFLAAAVVFASLGSASVGAQVRSIPLGNPGFDAGTTCASEAPWVDGHCEGGQSIVADGSITPNSAPNVFALVLGNVFGVFDGRGFLYQDTDEVIKAGEVYHLAFYLGRRDGHAGLDTKVSFRTVGGTTDLIATVISPTSLPERSMSPQVLTWVVPDTGDFLGQRLQVYFTLTNTSGAPYFSQVAIDTVSLHAVLPVATHPDDCKNSGWQQRFRSNGTAFKNQGDCMQYVNTGK